HSRQMLEATGKPYVMENVRPASRFIGQQDYGIGPFYLWGNCFAGMWPWPTMRLSKGIDVGSSKLVKFMTPEQKREYRAQFVWNQAWSSKKRQRDTAKAAEIPLPLSSHIAQMAGAI